MNRALSRLWQRVARRLGPAGVIGLGLLGALLAVTLSLPALHRHGEELRAAIADQLEVAAKAEAPTTPRRSAEDRVAEFVGTLPTLAQSSSDLEKMFALARQRALALPKGEYQLKQESGTSLLTYTVTFPVHSPYGVLKDFVADVLDAMPHVSMDEMRMSRPDAGSAVLDSQVRFTFVYRK
jgi:hypothetical protein